MKTLYLSDLDGTLLRRNARTSEETNRIINYLTAERGMLFSLATARSLITARKATAGLDVRFPMIIYNGTFTVDGVTGEILASNAFDVDVSAMLDELTAAEVYPMVYAHIDGKEKFSYVPELCTEGMKTHIASRSGDIRENPVASPEELYRGTPFYIACIGDPAKLEPFYHRYRENCHCVYSLDTYSGAQWLEIMPKTASKQNAAAALKRSLGCERLVVFGDGKNDIGLFEIADEAYAVSNAHEELKRRATAVIGSNEEDGVAKWLSERFG